MYDASHFPDFAQVLHPIQSMWDFVHPTLAHFLGIGDGSQPPFHQQPDQNLQELEAIQNSDLNAYHQGWDASQQQPGVQGHEIPPMAMGDGSINDPAMFYNANSNSYTQGWDAAQQNMVPPAPTSDYYNHSTPDQGVVQ